MSRPRKIRTPIGQRVRFFRQRQLPVLIWIAAVAAAVALARRQSIRVDAIGIVEVRQAAVAPNVAGRVKFVIPDLYDAVRAGELVGGLDEGRLVAELQVIKTEIGRLRAVIPAETARIQAANASLRLDRQTEARRFAWNVEGAELDLLDRRVALEVDRVENERLTLVLGRLRRLVSTGTVSQAEVDEAALARKAVSIRIDENTRVIATAERRRDSARTRLEALEREAALPPGLETQLEPIRRAVAVQEARLAELTVARAGLALRAPIDGVVSHILLRPGETALAGAAVLAIADPKSTRVVAHIPEGSGHLDVRVGDRVQLQRRTSPTQVLEAQVLRVGPAVEEIPLQGRRNPNLVEWGRPVLIAATGGNLDLYPGETIEVRIPAPSQRRSPAGRQDPPTSDPSPRSLED